MERVKQILNDYFGEENISQDFGCFFIKFDTVIIENENNDKHTIRGLYVRIEVTQQGILCGDFRIGRNLYTRDEIRAGYIHSHVQSNSVEYFNRFFTPCLGSGPIRSTISELNLEFDENLWLLFCRQLDQYVHTESLAGVPYIKMRSVSERSIYNTRNQLILSACPPSYILPTLNSINWADFISYFIDNIDNIGFTWGVKSSGFYFIQNIERDIIIKVSNLFLRWLNNNCPITKEYVELLIRKGILHEVSLYGSEIYYAPPREIIGLPTTPLCKFKEQYVYVTCIDNNEDNILDKHFALNPQIISFLLNNLIISINYANSKK